MIPKENTIINPSISITFDNILNSVHKSTIYPSQSFSQLTGKIIPTFITSILIFLIILGLIKRPYLLILGFSAQIIMGVIVLLYKGEYRHQGIFLIFLFFLYWLYYDFTFEQNYIFKIKTKILSHFGFGALRILILFNVAKLYQSTFKDIKFERSSNKAFGNFLNNNKNYFNAIILPEPDYLMESLPY